MMKNVKVKKRLILGFGVLVTLMLGMSLLAVLGMRELHQQNRILIEKTIANTDYVWEIRRNLISEQRYELMAFAEDDKTQLEKYLEAAQQDVDKNVSILEVYKQNARVEKSKINQLEDLFEKQTGLRSQIMSLLVQGTEAADRMAFRIFEGDFKPLQDELAALLTDIANEQYQVAGQQEQMGAKIYMRSLVVTIVLLVLAVVASSVIIQRLVKAITSPLTEITQAATALSQGDFNAQITYESRDEFGETCKKMQESFTNLKNIIAEVSFALGALSNGDLTTNLSGEFPGEMKEIESSIHKLTANLNESMSEIQTAASQINAGAEQVSDGAQALAQGATEQASGVEELSATIMDVSKQVEANSENADKANVLATNSGEVTKETLRDMEEMNSAMERISDTAENIKKVIKVIDDIAFQTNILALNAAVEAARAGAAGKGFAVVADEVRNLAGKSSDAVKNTTELVEDALEAVSQGAKIAQKTNTAFGNLAGKVEEIVSTIDEISKASREQAEAIREITAGMDQISAVVQTNSATSEESAAASEELSGQATMLSELVKRFKLDDSSSDSSFEAGYTEPVLNHENPENDSFAEKY